MNWTLVASFFVPGTPRPAGSKSAFPYKSKKTGKMRVAMVDASKHSPAWKKTIASYAWENYSGKPLEGPVKLRLTFFMPRPKSHFRTGRFSGQLKDSAPLQHLFKPDLSKLFRCAEDALTGILYKDDAQIIEHESPRKHYEDSSHPKGVFVALWALAMDDNKE